MRAEELLERLESVKSRGTGRWSAECPSHNDSNPSLSIHEGERGLLVKCWAGCTLEAITQALGIAVADLFYDKPLPRGLRPTRKPRKIDLVDVAFQFDLAALDRRLRAEQVFEAIKTLVVKDLSDDDLGKIMEAVARAHADVEKAELFEAVADDVRQHTFTQRERNGHAAA